MTFTGSYKQLIKVQKMGLKPACDRLTFFYEVQARGYTSTSVPTVSCSDHRWALIVTSVGFKPTNILPRMNSFTNLPNSSIYGGGDGIRTRGSMITNRVLYP